MKKMLSARLICLLMTVLAANVLDVSVTTTEDLHTIQALPEEVSREPMSANFTTDDYLNTTNPYFDKSPEGFLEENLCASRAIET